MNISCIIISTFLCGLLAAQPQKTTLDETRPASPRGRLAAFPSFNGLPEAVRAQILKMVNWRDAPTLAVTCQAWQETVNQQYSLEHIGPYLIIYCPGENAITTSANPHGKEEASTTECFKQTIVDKLFDKLFDKLVDKLCLDLSLFSFDDAKRFTQALYQVMGYKPLKLFTILMPDGEEEPARKLRQSLQYPMPEYVLTRYPEKMEIIPDKNQEDASATASLMQELAWYTPSNVVLNCRHCTYSATKVLSQAVLAVMRDREPLKLLTIYTPNKAEEESSGHTPMGRQLYQSQYDLILRQKDRECSGKTQSALPPKPNVLTDLTRHLRIVTGRDVRTQDEQSALKLCGLLQENTMHNLRDDWDITHEASGEHPLAFSQPQAPGFYSPSYFHPPWMGRPEESE